ncbi:MAG: hypothetical protein KGM47_12105 [Acidobacteriota bacterium]|nr:hypothetical protein [Acidobacteriota bacterium]
MENHIATAEDFRTALDCGRTVERVLLPKLRKPVLMRRPSPLWFIFRGQLPQALALPAAGCEEANRGGQTDEDVLTLTHWIFDLLREVMVQPRISLSPGPGEIPPDLIADEDLNFIIRWAVGEVVSDGSDDSATGDLTSFREN